MRMRFNFSLVAPKTSLSSLTMVSDFLFAKVFRKNIAIMFPCWIVPTIAGIYLLWTHLTILVAGVFLAFCIVGFALIPTISRFVGCAGCEIKDQCPWWGGIV